MRSLEEIQAIKQEQARRQSRRKLATYYPDSGPLRRELYVKHLEFFEAGIRFRERLMLAANRVGKTEGVGGYETALHLTGKYPEWWKGRRFNHPVKWWAAADTNLTARDILQAKLLGPLLKPGTGLIPGDDIGRMTRRSGVADAIDTVYIRHVSGGNSQLVFKSYEGGVEAFQGTEQDGVWLDEEPPLAIYIEALMRTMSCNGMALLTFTPLLGMSDVVLQFLPGGQLKERADGTKFVVMATWDDAPHLSEKAKSDLLYSIPPYQRDARSKGIPQLGAGAIYPVPEGDIAVDPFPIPAHWPRGYGMDVGWNFTAGIWGAYDRETETLYLYHEYKRGEVEPSVHAHAFKAPGAWIPGFIDPASRGRAQGDGKQLLHDYQQLGLRLTLADNGVESGLYSCWNRMSSGKIRVFSTLSRWFEEFRLYRRDEKGRVIKTADHLMDGMRYLESRIHQMIVEPINKAAAGPRPSYTAWS
jgi:phage terminase large subunit-like protein